MLGFMFSRLHHCFTVSPDACLASSISDRFCSWIFFLSMIILFMLFPPAYSEGRTADIYRGFFLSLEFSVPDHFSMDFFALRDAGLFGGYVKAPQRIVRWRLKIMAEMFNPCNRHTKNQPNNTGSYTRSGTR